MRLGLLVRQGPGFSRGSCFDFGSGEAVYDRDDEAEPLNAVNPEWVKCEENRDYEYHRSLPSPYPVFFSVPKRGLACGYE